MPTPLRVVFDTSVLVAAARSRRGASFALVSSIPAEQFQLCLSVGLYLEWQGVLTRADNLPAGMAVDDALGFLRYLCGHAWPQEVYFHWRPFLGDPNDDMILELAFAAGAPYIVTHNVRHFAGSDQFGIEVLTPGAFLKKLREGLVA